MLDKKVRATDLNNNPVSGIVKLVYDEALASGTNEYVNITHVLVKEENSDLCHVVRPRDIFEIIDL